MEKDIMNEPLLKERSYVKSMSTGIRLPLRHPWGFLRHLWPMLVVSIILWAVASAWLAPHLWTLRGVALTPGIAPSDILCPAFWQVSAWGMMGIVLLGVLVGQVGYLMQRYAELTYLPAVQPWKLWSDIMPCVLRGLLTTIVWYVVALAFVVLSLAVMPSRLWALVLCVFLVMTWTFIYVCAGQQYMLGQRSLFSAFAWPFKNFSSVGGSTAILVVCGLLVASVIAIGCIPALSTIFVGGLSDNAVEIGDETDIPSNFALLRSICFGLAALVANIAWPFVLVPLAFNWGSQEAERLEDEGNEVPLS